MSIETGMGNITGASPVQLDISATTAVVCECGNYTFEEVMMFKKFSALVSGTGKPAIAPIPTFSCVACGNVNADFLPNVSPVQQADPAQLKLEL